MLLSYYRLAVTVDCSMMIDYHHLQLQMLLTSTDFLTLTCDNVSCTESQTISLLGNDCEMCSVYRMHAAWFNRPMNDGQVDIVALAANTERQDSDFPSNPWGRNLSSHSLIHSSSILHLSSFTPNSSPVLVHSL